MRIAIQAADLDASRIDGTRVYILNLLRRFGSIAPWDDFYIYHKSEFNPELIPPNFPNYKIKKIKSPLLWTQTRFAWELLKDKPDVLWMPMHNIPLIRSKKIKTAVTVHDLAYKYFPDYFPSKDLFLLNLLGDMAIKNASKLIAISESTKRDILKFYPAVKEEKIKVIYHGFDADLFQKNIPTEEKDSVLKSYDLKSKGYILYSGAIQPRKNLVRLIEAFGIFKNNTSSDVKLVLAGEKAWLWESILAKAENSPFKDDIIITGKLKFSDLSVLTRSAGVYAYPSLYEGFGMPILEAQSAGVPVVAGDNSSIREIITLPFSPWIRRDVPEGQRGGDDASQVLPLAPSLSRRGGMESAILADPSDAEQIAEAAYKLISDKNLRDDIIKRGYENVKRFSWEKCANETLDWMKS